MSDTETRWVRVEQAGAVRHVILSAPTGPNRISLDCVRQWRHAAAEAAGDPLVRVIVLSANGATWNVGGDLAQMRDAGEGVGKLIDAIGEAVNPLAVLLHTCDKVTVAAVHGAVAGGALGLMSACDLVVAADDTVITQGYARLGINPDAGVTWFLPRIIGYRRALQMYLTSERLSADEALRLGIVSQVVPSRALAEEVRALTDRIAALSPTALIETKRLFRTAFDTSLDAQLKDEIGRFAATSTTAHFAEGLSAFFERRDPVFE